MYEDHLKTCDYCQKGSVNKTHGYKPTIRIKSASNYYENKKPTIYIKAPADYSKYKKLTELGAIIKGISYPSLEHMLQTKGASAIKKITRPGPIEREVKLRELGKMVRGC